MAVVSAVETYKKQRNLQAEDERTEKWAPMPLPFINEFTLRQMSVVPTSATNPAPFDRRRRPICKPASAVKE
jgi:hypothetical protein